MAQILIDNQSPNKKFAWTTDIRKITENRNTLRSISFSKSIKMLGDNGFKISLFSIGRYITVVRIKPDEIPDKMYFFDYTWDISQAEFQLLLQGIYTKELEKEWFNIQWNLYSTFNESMDIVELCKT
ncbi:MAG: hypothetical protein ACO1PI_10215 [Bacteroidota bacterium]